MANNTVDDWDKNSPANSDALSVGAQETRLLREGVGDRIAKEHEAPAGSGDGGEHLEGSAKVYRQAEAPTKKPDGVDDLDSDDEGRVFVDSDNENVQTYDGSSWNDIQIKTDNLEDDAVDGTKIADDAVGNEHLENDAVNTDEIVDGAVELAKMAAESVDSDQYVDGSVDLAHLAAEVAARFNCIEIGNYSGTGASNTITKLTPGGADLSFDPEVLIISRGLITSPKVLFGIAFKNFNSGGDSHFVYGFTEEFVSAAITMGTKQFILTGNDAPLNSSGVTYHFMALRTNTS